MAHAGKIVKTFPKSGLFINENNFLMKNDYLSEWQMRMATSVHHTNPRSATLDFWRKTTRFDDYKMIQAKRRAQMNRPTRLDSILYSKSCGLKVRKPDGPMVYRRWVF